MSGSGQIRQKAEAGDWGHAALNFWDNDYEALRQIVQAMKPAKVEGAGTAYEEMAARMKSSMDLIRKQAQALTEAWKGDPADAALTKLRDLHDAAFQIQSKSSDTGAALKDHAATQRKWQSTIKEEKWYGVEVGTGDTGVGDWLQGESHMGRELMQQMQRDTVESNERFPAELRAGAVDVGVVGFDPIEEENKKGPASAHPGSGGSGGGASGNLSTSHPSTTNGSDSFGNGGHLIGGTGSGGGTGSVPPGGSGVGVGDDPLAGSVIGGDTGLAGFNPGSGARAAAGVGALGGPGGAPGIGGFGAGPGGGAFAGPGAAGAMGLGAGGLVSGSTTGGAAGSGAGRGGMMPMAPQAGQQDEKERERSTWLTEDDDVWNSGDGTTPPVIG